MTMTGLVGIALLPDADIAARLVDFAHRWRAEIDEPRPRTRTNLPHVSVHQFPTDDAEQVAAAVSGRLTRHQPRTSRIGALAHQPVGWLFADVERQSWMDDLQAEVVDLVDHLVDRTALKRADQLTGYTAAESASYLRHGYRYVGATYRPHVTVGRTTTDSLSLTTACLADYDARLLDRTVRFDQLVVLRAGPFGAVAEVLTSI